MIPAHLVEQLSTALARWDGRGPTDVDTPKAGRLQSVSSLLDLTAPPDRDKTAPLVAQHPTDRGTAEAESLGDHRHRLAAVAHRARSRSRVGVCLKRQGGDTGPALAA
jgi:hypothetical protein